MEKQRREKEGERGCDVVKNRLLKRMNAKCLSKHKTSKMRFQEQCFHLYVRFSVAGVNIIVQRSSYNGPGMSPSKERYYQVREIYI